MFIGENWKDIAKGNTAFIIAGGPSVKNIEDNKLKELIKNNFTITVNYNIEFYDDISMYVTSDNRIARQFFELDSFVLYDVELKDWSCSKCNEKSPPILQVTDMKRYESKAKHLLEKPEMIKVIIGQSLNSLGEPVNGGQLHLGKAVRSYKNYHKNLFLMNEYKEQANYSVFGVTGPKLNKDWEQIWDIYGKFEHSRINIDGTQVLQARPGGNIVSQILQLLYHMNFDKVVTIGWGDGGDSKGSTDNFIWSEDEINSIPVHNKMWGDRLKILSGGEILKEYGDFKSADFNDLCDNSTEKNKLIERIYGTNSRS